MFILLLLLACGDRVEREELIGIYTCSEGGTDILELNDDGTYRYKINVLGREMENSATWKLTVFNEVQFEDFTFLRDPSLPKGNWFSRLRSQDNEIHLMYASDSNIYFTKVGTAKN
jgi:hypothetical protein